MKLYISGPIKGIANAKDNFADAVIALRSAGFTTLNPFDVDALCSQTCNGLDDDAHYDCFMRGDLAAMMDCGGVALIGGWEQSRGARLESALALQVGIPVKSLITWLGACAVCGCTEDDCSRCVERTGEACSWIESNLCSACA